VFPHRGGAAASESSQQAIPPSRRLAMNTITYEVEFDTEIVAH
jgi:hypothetical protein